MPRKGGKAIASGSYGCVFRPALKCKGSSEAGRHSGVSKLMYTTDANDEMDEMKPILETVKRIPGSEKFFAVSDINMCSPDSLNDSDKEKFNEKSNLFIDEGINSDSINSNLRDFSNALSDYIFQILKFLLYSSDEKPFPFADFPEVGDDLPTTKKSPGSKKTATKTEKEESTVKQTPEKKPEKKPAAKKIAKKKSSSSKTEPNNLNNAASDKNNANDNEA